MPKKSQHAGDPVLVALGRAIRLYRSQRGISQEVLAYDAGVDRAYLGGIERGEHNVALINLHKISACLGITVADLMRMARL